MQQPENIPTVTLYGSPCSLYTGRARSYLIKNGIDYRETGPTSQHYEDHVLPAAGGRRGMPTIEFADGAVIRDSVAIVDYFEQEGGHPNSPQTPKHKIINRLLDVIAAEGMLRPAVHYRWNFPENEPLIQFQFEHMTPIDPAVEFTVEGRFAKMRQACIDLGVPEENHALVESLYFDLVEKLDAHFANYPHLLGGRPSVADFGLIAPMYGHLGRDIKPLSILHEHGNWVLRWVERMNRPEPDVGEYENPLEDYFADDEIPDTLVDVLKQFAIDFVPETLAACDANNEWLASENPAAGSEVPRVAGFGTFEVKGNVIHAGAQPFRFYLLRRVQDEYEQLNESDRSDVTELLERCDMLPVMEAKLTRDIGRDNNLEVWL